MPNWTGEWEGGRTYERDGRTVYVLERMRHARRYSIPLDAGNEREARAELALFLRDPAGYATRSQAVESGTADAIVMDAGTVGRFLARLRETGRTEHYRQKTHHYLVEWTRALAGQDLRRVTLREYKRILASWSTSRGKRIAALKSFCSYLREEEALLAPNEDASLSLKVPQARPERAVRKKGYEREEVERVYRAIDQQAIRDVILVHAKTGMHRSEIERIAGGQAEIAEVETRSAIAATVKFVHKSGRVHTQSIDAQTLAALRRLRERGAAPVHTYARTWLRRAAAKLGAEPIKEGELRHSFVAWARVHGEEVRPAEGGVPLVLIAQALGHTNARTTSRFYDVTEVPPMIRIPIRLEHPDDPAVSDRKSPPPRCAQA